METTLQIRRAVETEIQAAFRGVTLGQGISLRQARFADRFQDVPPHLRMGEITDDWTQVPLDELQSESDGNRAPRCVRISLLPSSANAERAQPLRIILDAS